MVYSEKKIIYDNTKLALERYEEGEKTRGKIGTEREEREKREKGDEG